VLRNQCHDRGDRQACRQPPSRCRGEGALWVGAEDAFADEIQHFLTGVRRPVVSDRVLATVLFTDIVGSTERAAELGDAAWRSLLERHDRVVREEVERHRGRFVKSLGDGALAVFDGPSRAISCATSIRDRVRDLGLEIRAGLHTGECELFPDDDVGGLAVHIGARVSSLAGPGEVLVSSTVRDLSVGSGQMLTDRGEHDLKGVPDRGESLRSPISRDAETPSPRFLQFGGPPTRMNKRW
jgi:class 3 adenylate cyclase